MSYNAHVQIVKDSPSARVMRVYPSFPIVRYLAGQYGSLGLLSPSGSGKLIKRPYSLSSSIISLASSSLIDLHDLNYFEFYFNMLPDPSTEGEHLTPLLFSLKDGDPIFCGSKVVGYYTLKEVSSTRNLLLLGSATGEAPNNAIVNSALLAGWSGRICQINSGMTGWQSLYLEEQRATEGVYPGYRYLSRAESGYATLEALIRNCLSDSDYSFETLGFVFNPDTTHVFLCGDPSLIGAPKKLGGWKYETPDYGLLRILEGAGFKVKTKFQEGNLDFETYW